VNKHNKCEDRALLVTDKFVFKLDPGKKYKAMTSGIPLAKVRRTVDHSMCGVEQKLFSKNTVYIFGCV